MNAFPIMQTGDLHLEDKSLDDQLPVIDWIIETAKKANIKTLIVAGDLAGTPCPHMASPSERNALLRLCGVVDNVFILRGNHDVMQDWQFLDHVDGCTWVSEPEYVAFDDCDLFMMPYPDGSRAAAAGIDINHAAETVLAGFGVTARADTPSVLSAHINVNGSISSSGQPLIGQDYEIRHSSLMAAGIDFGMFNHIHKSQEINDSPEYVHVGSPWATSFGEQDDKKRVVILDGLAISTVPTPCIPRLTVDLSWSDGWGELPDVAGARVKCRIAYTEGEDVSIPKLDGALSVKYEHIVTRHDRRRSPEIVKTLTPVERFRLYEEENGREVSIDHEEYLVRLT
jgi:DNA repair exonuclease SbcCD nuclease subunit